MEYQLELKPLRAENGTKLKVIQITDLTLHTAKKHATASISKKLKESLGSNQPGRIYAPLQTSSPKEEYSQEEKVGMIDMLKKDPEFVKMVQEENKNGYKVVIAFPRAGVPVLAGKDTLEFMNSKNGKRIIRGLAKEKDKE